MSKPARRKPTATILSESLPADLAVLLAQVAEAGVGPPEREFEFHPERKFRFDLAWPALKVAFEREGGTEGKSRHTSADGYESDCEKYNLAGLAGWLVVRGTRHMLASGSAAYHLIRALRLRKLYRDRLPIVAEET